MPGKLNVYSLGEKGVNVVKSPIHLDDGELVSAQNVILNPEGETGGLQKRGGLSKLNSSALAGGAVKGIITVPLPDPGSTTTYLYAAQGTADANTWYRTTDGATWTATTTPSSPQQNDKKPSSDVYYANLLVTLNGSLYYPSDAYTLDVTVPYDSGTAPPLMVWDYAQDLEVLTVPYNPIGTTANVPRVILNMVQHRGNLYFSCHELGGTAPNHRGRVFKLDPSTGTLTQVGNRFGGGTNENLGGMPYCLASYNGYLWTGTYGIGGSAAGLIYRIQPGIDETWTLDHTTAVGAGYITSMVSYRGDLFASTMADAGSAALVLKRTAGTWSTTRTGPTTTPGYYNALTVFNSTLFVCYVDIGAGSRTLVDSYDGTTWSNDLNVGTTYAVRDTGATITFGGNLYWAFCATGSGLGNSDGFVLKRTTGGVWTQPLASANVRGYLGLVEVTA